MIVHRVLVDAYRLALGGEASYGAGELGKGRPSDDSRRESVDHSGIPLCVRRAKPKLCSTEEVARFKQRIFVTK